MCAAFRQATQSEYGYGGVHVCGCGAISSSSDHFLPDGSMTNSLCIHYVAHHRTAVSTEELGIIAAFGWGEADPNDRELLGPAFIAAGTRRLVERSIGHAALKVLCASGPDVQGFCAQLRSENSERRQGAEQLLAMLQFFSHRMEAFSAALDRLKLDAVTWGDESLRLPVWNRAAWLVPMIELLRGSYDDCRERRRLAFHFRYLRSHGAVIPQELIKLNETTDEHLKAAVSLAIQGLSGD